MRIVKSIVLTLAIFSPVATYAFAAGERASEEIIKEHQQVISKYANSKNTALPAVVEYKYGMDLDIAKVVRLSPEAKTCAVMPQLMTYEDSKGDLKTVQYRVFSQCRGKN